MHELVRKRQNRRSLSKKISWALYRKKQLDRLLEDIHDLVNGLVSVFPAERLRRIAEAEVEEMGDATQLRALTQAAQEDPVLHDAAVRRLRMLTGNHIDDANVSGTARVQVGNKYIRVSELVNAETTFNRIGKLRANESADVHVENSM
jgi:hypothetical protein